LFCPGIIEEVDEDGSGTLDFDGGVSKTAIKKVICLEKKCIFLFRISRNDDGLKEKLYLFNSRNIERTKGFLLKSTCKTT